MTDRSRVIRITCDGADHLPVSAFRNFQGNLKTLHQNQFNKLKEAIIKYGFSFPIMVWRNGEENFMIDGHQRLFVIRNMLENGWRLERDEVPVVWIHAETQKEAKEKVLLSAGQYGEISLESLYEFINLEELDFESLEPSISLPKIDLDRYRDGYTPGHSASPYPTTEQVQSMQERFDDQFAKRSREEQGDYIEVDCIHCRKTFYVSRRELLNVFGATEPERT